MRRDIRWTHHDTIGFREGIPMTRQTAWGASHHGRSACGMVAAVGFFGLVAQTLLFRQFLTAFEGNELGIALFFSSWLAWVAAGALLAHSRARWLDALAARLEFVALLYIPACIFQSWLIHHARDLSGVAAYELFPLARMVPASVLANAPMSLLTGMLFAMACKWMSNESHLSVAMVYICETVGSCAGGFAVTVLLWRGAAGETVLLAASVVLSAAFCLCRLARGGWASAAVPLLAVFAAHFTGLDEAWRHANDLHTWQRLLPAETCRGAFTTPQARYLYGEHRGQINVVAWESIAESIPNTEYASAVIATHLAQHPAARRFLVTGSGSFAICRRLLALPQTQSVTWLDTDPAYPAHLLRILPEPLRAGAERLTIPGTDVRDHLRETAEEYDLVILNLPDATTLTLNRYFTREFFQLLKARLADGGVVGVPVSGGENFMGEELINVGASVYHTLGSVFGHRVIKPGDQSWIIASDAARLTASPALLRDRFRGIENAEQLYPAEGLMSLYLPDRIEAQEARYRAAIEGAPEGALLNTDRRPKALFHSLQFAALEAGTALSLTAALRAFAAHGRLFVPLALCIYGMLRFVFLLRDPRRAGRDVEGGALTFESDFLVFSTGAAGMALSITLMFMYQSVHGSIFLHVGLIAAIFMLGLFAGSLAVERCMARAGGLGNGALFGIIAMHSALIVTMVRLPSNLPRGAFALLFLFSGLFSGVYVPLAASRLKAAGVGDRAAGALLELNDHLGGCCGGLITGLILLPVFGNAYALVLVAGALAINLPPLFLRTRSGETLPARDRYASVVRAAGYTMFGLAAFVLGASLRLQQGARPSVTRLLREAAATMAGETAPVERRQALSGGSELNYYTVTNAAGGMEAYLFSTEQLAPGIAGYGGPLVLAVMPDAKGGLLDFRIIRSGETPVYLDMLAAWMRSLKGRNLFAADALADVDAVTGATLSSEAICRTLSTAGQEFARRVLGVAVGQAELPQMQRGPDVRFLAVAILAALALALRTRPHRRARQAFLALVVVGSGWMLNTQYSLAQVLSLLGLQFPPVGWNVVCLLVLALPVFVVLFGNVYCGYLCPFGALQELVGDLRPARLRTDPGRASWRFGRLVKFLLLFLVIIAFASTLDHALASSDPLVAVFNSARSRFITCLAGAVLVLSFFYGRFWCRTLCPAGAFLALLNGARLLKHLVPGVNHDLCPFGVSSGRELDCICCDRCRVVGPRAREALKAARREPTRVGRRAVFVLVVAALALLMVWRVVLDCSSLRQATPGASGGTAAGGQPRDVDMPRLRRMIEQRVLSDREARYYKPVTDPSGPAGENPPKQRQPVFDDE